MNLRNVATVLANPRLGFEYVGWTLDRARTGNASFALLNGARIGNFVNFSEYHSMVRCISPAEQRFFVERIAQETGDIIDIGANVGVVSVLVGRQFPERTVYAIEPAPGTFAALGKNIALNALDNVQAYQLALADAPGSLAFNANPLERATARIATSQDTHVQTVEATTLDLFVERAGITAVALLKIDVEGFETLVFEGARETLARRLARVIFMEVCPPLTRSAGFDPSRPAQAVADAGYTWFRLEETGALVPIAPEQAKGVTLENWVALPV